MVSGDRRSVAERVGRSLGVDRVYAELTPEEARTGAVTPTIVFVPVDEMGQPGHPGTPGVQMEAFVAGTEPRAMLTAAGATEP